MKTKFVFFLAFFIILSACSKGGNSSKAITKTIDNPAEFSIETNPLTFELRDNGIIVSDSNTLSLGDIFVGTQLSQKIYISNVSSETKIIELGSISSQNFIIDNNCTSLEPRRNCFLTLKHQAVTSKSISETLSILGTSISVNLNIIQKPLKPNPIYVSVDSLNFGSFVGSKLIKSFNILNTTLDPASIVIENPSNVDFNVFSNCPSNLAGRKGCSVDIEYMSDIDLSKISETVSSVIKVNAINIPLSALEENKTNDFSNVGFSQTSLNFGNFESGHNKIMSVRITNRDTKPKNIVIDSSNLGPFMIIKNTCSGVLEFRRACNIDVRFSANQKGNFSNSLIIAGKTLPISSSVPQGGILTNALNVSSELLDFGIMPSNSSKTLSLFIQNTSLLPLSQISVTTPVYYTVVSNSCTGTLDPRRTCKVDYLVQTANKPSLIFSENVTVSASATIKTVELKTDIQGNFPPVACTSSDITNSQNVEGFRPFCLATACSGAYVLSGDRKTCSPPPSALYAVDRQYSVQLGGYTPVLLNYKNIVGAGDNNYTNVTYQIIEQNLGSGEYSCSTPTSCIYIPSNLGSYYFILKGTRPNGEVATARVDISVFGSENVPEFASPGKIQVTVQQGDTIDFNLITATSGSDSIRYELDQYPAVGQLSNCLNLQFADNSNNDLSCRYLANGNLFSTSFTYKAINTSNNKFSLKEVQINILDSDNILDVYPSRWASLALNDAGSVFGRGLNESRIFGIDQDYKSSNFVFESTNAIKVPLNDKVSKLWVKGNSAIAKLENGQYWAWGQNRRSRLGIQSYNPSGDIIYRPQQVTLLNNRDFIQITMNDNSACGLTNLGEVYCWGSNEFSELAANITTPSYGDASQLRKVNFGNKSQAQDSSIVWDTNLAEYTLSSNGAASRILPISNWAMFIKSNQKKSVGDFELTFTANETDLSHGWFVGSSKTLDLEYGANLAGFYFNNGTLRTYGNSAERITATMVSGLNTFKVKRVGSNVQYILNGVQVDQVSYGAEDIYPVARLNGRILSASVIGVHNRVASFLAESSVRSNTHCAIVENEAFCWGLNTKGQLGAGRTSVQLPSSATPIKVLLGENVKKISVGASFNCAVTNSDRVKCWGANSLGQLGIGDSTDRGLTEADMQNLPFINLGTDASSQPLKSREVYIGAGGDSICSILFDYRVKCWGANSLGQLGIGDIQNRGSLDSQMGNNLPYLKNVNNIDLIAAYLRTSGEEDFCLRSNVDAKVYCWGNSQFSSVSPIFPNTPSIPREYFINPGDTAPFLATGATIARDFTTNQGQTKTIGSISPTNFKDLYSSEDSVLYFFDESSNVNIYTGVVYDSLDNTKIAGRLALNCLNGINRNQLNSCLFTPEPNYKGTFVLKYKACSPNLKCSDTIITLNSRVADPNIPYFANTQLNQTFNLNRFESKTFTIPLATDPQSKPWGYFISSNSARKGFYNFVQLYTDDGKIAGIFDQSCFTQYNQNTIPSIYDHSMRNPTCTFHPKENFTGSASLKYVVKNNSGFVTEERSVTFNILNSSTNVLHGLGYKSAFGGYTKMARFPEQFGPNNSSYSGMFLSLGGSDNPVYANIYSDKDVYPTPVVQNVIEDFDKTKVYGANTISRMLMSNVSSIKGENNNYCAVISSSNKLVCWSTNIDNMNSGQLNPSMTVYYYNPEYQVPRIISKPDLSGAMTSVVDYGIGDRFGCAIHGVNKNVTCWGKEVKGCGATFTPGTPCNVIRDADNSPLVNAKSIDVGPASACAVVNENSVDKLYCWGYKLDANGNGSVSRSLVDYANANNYDLKAKEINVPNPVKVSMGQQNACVSSSNNKLYCFGFNGPYGLLGRGSTNSSLFFDPAPVRFDGNDLLVDTTVFDVGNYNYDSDSACAMGLNSKLYCWGYSSHFKLWEKNPGTYNSAQEINLSEISPIEKVAVSDSGICYQTIDNKLKCWGSNSYGQFGSEPLGWLSILESNYVKNEPTSINPTVVSDFSFGGGLLYLISPQLIENHEYYQQGSLGSQVAEQTTLNATLVTSLTENDEIVIMRKPSYGVISEGNTLTTLNYTPTNTIASNGEPLFDYITYYKVSDPSKAYKYIFEITPVNNPPIAQDVETFAFVANDKYIYNSTVGSEPESEPYAIEFLTQPQFGTFSNCYMYPGFASQFYQYCAYRPNAGTIGQEENISFRLYDKKGYSATKNLKIKIFDNNALTPNSLYTEINTLSYYNTTFVGPRANSPQGEATGISIISGFLNDGGIYKVKTAEDITLGTIDVNCFLSGSISNYSCIFRPIKGIIGTASIKYRLTNGSLQTPELEIKINVGSNMNNLLYSIGYVQSSFSGGGSYQTSSYLYRLQGGTNPAIQAGDPYPIPHISKALIETPVGGFIWGSADGRHIKTDIEQLIHSSNQSETFLAISNGSAYISSSLDSSNQLTHVSYYYGGYGLSKMFFNNNQPIEGVTSGGIGTNQVCAIYGLDNKLACAGRTRYDSISQNEILRSGCGPKDTYTRKGFACPIVKRDLSQLNNVLKVVSKNNSTCAIVDENGKGQVYCWGFRFDSTNTFDSRSESTRAHNTNYAEKIPGFESDNVVDLVMLDNRACSVLSNGKISCFGQTSSYYGAKNRPNLSSKFMPKYNFIADATVSGTITLKQIVDEHVIVEVPINSTDNSGIGLSNWIVINEDDISPSIEVSNDRVSGGITYKSLKIKLQNKKPYQVQFAKDAYSFSGSVAMVAIKEDSLIMNNSVICANSENNDFYCWGGDYSTQSLNNVQNQYFNQTEITKVEWMSSIEPFKKIKFGSSNMCLINLNDELKCWGLISYGNNGMEQHSGATTYYVKYADAESVKEKVDGQPVPVKDFISVSSSTLMLVENVLDINIDPQPVEFSVNENSSIAGLIPDIDTSKYEYFILTKPSYGVLSGDINNLTYTAINNYNGQDQFTYRVYDKVRNYSVAKTVILKVKDANNLPKAEDRFYSLEKNTTNFYVYFNGSDVDGNPLTYIRETEPQNGTLSGCVSSYCIYTPNQNYVGVDSFTYKVSDGRGFSSVKTVSLEIRDDRKPYFSNSLFEYNVPRNSSRYVAVLPSAKTPNHNSTPYYELVYNSNVIKEINNIVSFKQNGEIIATVSNCFMAQPIGSYSGDVNCEFKFIKQIVGTLSFEIIASNPNSSPLAKSDNITINLNIGNSGKSLYALGYTNGTITTNPLGHFETNSMEYRIRGGSLGNQQISHLADKELYPVPMMYYNTVFNDVQMMTSDDSGGICWQNNDASKKVYCLNTANSNNQFGVLSFGYWTPGPIQDITYSDNSSVANLQKIEAGTFQTCGIEQDGKALCWGNTLPSSVAPTAIDYTGCGFSSSVTPRGKACNLVDESNNYINNVVDISVGASQNGCLIRNENSIGQVYCWGIGFDNPATITQSVKSMASLNTKSAAKVSVGDNYVCVAYTDNTIKCMGSNSYGRIGINQTDGAYKPATDLVFENSSQQSIGIKPHTLQTKPYMACAIDLEDKLQCWGYSDRGILTKPAQYPTTSTYKYKPTRILESQDIQSYTLGSTSLCTVNNLSEVRCVGDNTYGHLGNPRTLIEYNTTSVFNNTNYISESEIRPIKEYLGQTNIKVDDIVTTTYNTYVLVNSANTFDVPLIDVQEMSQDVMENESFNFSLGSTNNLYYIFRRPDYAKITGDSPQNLFFNVSDSQQNSYIDYITFLMRDMLGNSTVKKYVFKVTKQNDKPLYVNRELITYSGATFNFTHQSTDLDSTSFTYTITQQPLFGTLNCTGASCTYIAPMRNQNDPDLIDVINVKVTDNHGADSAIDGIVTIVIKPISNPVFDTNFVTFSIYENTPSLQLRLPRVKDPRNGSQIAYQQTNNTIRSIIHPTLGQIAAVYDKNNSNTVAGYISGCALGVNPPSVADISSCTFTVLNNFIGTARFEYIASNGSEASAVVVAELEVKPINQLPNSLFVTGYVEISRSGNMHKTAGQETNYDFFVFAEQNESYIDSQIDIILNPVGNVENMYYNPKRHGWCIRKESSLYSGKFFVSCRAGDAYVGRRLGPSYPYWVPNYDILNQRFIPINDENNSYPQYEINSFAYGLSQTCATVGVENELVCWGETQDYGSAESTARTSGCGFNHSITNNNIPCNIVSKQEEKIKNVIDMGLGGLDRCVIVDDNGFGRLLCWGYENAGKNGQEMVSAPNWTTERNFAMPIFGLENVSFRNVEAADGFACAETNNGKLYCWGHNKSGQLGRNSYDQQSYWTTMSYPAEEITIMDNSSPVGVKPNTLALVNSTACAIGADHQIYCWGASLFGNFYADSAGSKLVPTKLTGFSQSYDFKKIKMGENSMCGILLSDEVICWGYNPYKTLGNINVGGTVTRAQAVKMTDPSNSQIIQVKDLIILPSYNIIFIKK